MRDVFVFLYRNLQKIIKSYFYYIRTFLSWIIHITIILILNLDKAKYIWKYFKKLESVASWFHSWNEIFNILIFLALVTKQNAALSSATQHTNFIIRRTFTYKKKHCTVSSAICLLNDRYLDSLYPILFIENIHL